MSTLRDEDAIHLVTRRPRAQGDGPADRALAALQSALSAHDVDARAHDYWTELDHDAWLVAGTTDDRVLGRLLDDAGVDVDPSRPEGVIYQWCDVPAGGAAGSAADSGDGVDAGNNTDDHGVDEGHVGRVLVVAGTDDRGLAYALYELAERIRHEGPEALEDVENTVEFPDNEVRGIDRFIEGPIVDEWLFEDEFWHYYLERLVRCRFNRFALVAGYDTAYLSPPYPFVVEVPGYPDVELADPEISREQLRERLRWIGERCREYGLEFVFGIWQQQPWTDVQGMQVEGLPEGREYADYCAAGLRELLVACPEIDGVQLRVNYESGVTADGDRETAEDFWKRIIDAVDEAGDERGEEIGLDLRAKGLTDGMIDHSLEQGLDVTVPTKFWCESTGLPYHNTQMRSEELANLDDPNKSRRYSYADLLEEPRSYDILYRLWVTGTNRIFVWGDPDYARRFSEATQFGDSRGYQITAPLSLKGGHVALHDENWPLFDDPDLREGEWEDERYWAWYRLFGRLGYDGETDPDVWNREFRNRFGDAADAVERGYRAASKVLPLITAFHLTAHPALHNWAEFDTGGALFGEHNFNDRFGDTTYATAEPSDPGLFYAIDEYVEDVRAERVRGKYTPPQIASWLASFAKRTRNAVADAEADAEDATAETAAFRATVLDLRMLADLAEYHAYKIHAAIDLELARQTDDPARLADAYAAANVARRAWESLATRGDGTYHDDLVFGRGPANGDAGTWADRFDEIDADLEELDRRLEDASVDAAIGAVPAFDDDATTCQIPPAATPYVLDVPDRHPATEPLDVSVRASDAIDDDERVQLHYRRANQLEGEFERVEMERTERGYRATIPESYLTPAFDLLAYVSVVDGERVRLVPGTCHPTEQLPYHIVEIEDAPARD